MKLVHAADLHLDSPLRGLEQYEGAPVQRIRGATRGALKNLVTLCLEEEADALLLAGDLYDDDWRDYATGLFFVSQMARLREAGVRVYLVRGNHDAANKMTKQLDLPAHVEELSYSAPETRRDDELGLAVHGQGFARREVTDNLAAGYPDAVPGYFNVGLLHTALTGREDHEPYAPCDLDTLRSKGYDYWALGHVHAREVVSRDPWVVYPGNLQGRHARETGPKGASVVTVQDGAVATVEHRALDTVRWERLEVDAAPAGSGDEVVDRATAALERAASEAGDRLLAARVVVTGESHAHDALHAEPERFDSAIRAAALELGDDVWVEKIRFATTPPVDLDAVAQRDDAIGQLLRSLRELAGDDEALQSLRDELSELEPKLPAEAREGDDGLQLDDPKVLRDALADVERMLLPRLLARTGGDR